MAIIDKIDKLSGTDTRSRNITQAIDKYSGKGPSKNIDDAVKKLDETGTLGKMGIKERIDHLSNAQTMSRDITQAIDRHTGKGPSRNIEEALKNWEEPTPPGPGITEAYAVFDSADRSFVFFRDEPGKYSEGQVEDTKTYYTGVETKTSGFGWRVKINPTSVRFDDEITPVSTLDWFRECVGLTSIIGLDKLNTSNVTNMSFMFRKCKALTSLDVSGFNTSKVTTMEGMFKDCEALTSLNTSGLNTSNVNSMQNIFSGCRSLTSLDVSSFDTSNVTKMYGMFDNCQSLTSLDVSGFNTSNTTNMSDMFNNCLSLTSLDVSGFDISNADIGRMFCDCRSLTTDITISDISKYSGDTFANVAIKPPAKITLYGEGSVTSADIDTLIDVVKRSSPEGDPNIVNGMAPAKDVVADTDIYFENTDYDTQEFPQLLTVSLNSKVNINISNYEEYNFDTNEWEKLEVNLVPQPLTIDSGNVNFMTAPVPISGWESYDRQFTLGLYDADIYSARLGTGVVTEAHYSEIGPARLRFHMKITKVE